VINEDMRGLVVRGPTLLFSGRDVAGGVLLFAFCLFWNFLKFNFPNLKALWTYVPHT